MGSSELPLQSWSESVHQVLTSLIPKKRGLCCFDFDNTLIRNDFGEKMMEEVLHDSMEHVGADLSRWFRDEELWKDHRKIPKATKEQLVWEEYAYQLREYGIERGYRWTVFLFEGLDSQSFATLSRRGWARVSVPRHPGAVFPQPEMQSLIRFLAEHGWESWIVTASPEMGVQAIAQEFPITESRVLGMRAETDSLGRNTRQIREPYTYGEGKVRAIQERIGKKPDLAFGDSFNDFPMLCYAEQGVAIDRGNPEFVQACQSKGILIQPYFLYQD